MAINFAVIFDLDGTLVNSKTLAMAATKVALEQNGFSDVVVDEKSYDFGSRYVTPKRLAWHATGQADDPCGPVLAVTFENYVSDQVTTKNTPLYAGMTDLLNHLLSENVCLGVLSNASSNYVQQVVKQNQLQDTFKAYYGADDVSDAKPQPDGLIAICHQFQTDVSNCIYVGDSPSDGIAASRAGTGMYSIGVTWGNNSHDELASHFNEIVSSASELQLAIDTFFSNKHKVEEENGDKKSSIEETETTSTDTGTSSSTSHVETGTEAGEPRRRVSWQNDVIDNEHMNKLRTDDEYWDGR